MELQSLSVDDFEAILTSTDASLTKQYKALLATEGVSLDFQPSGITSSRPFASQHARLAVKMTDEKNKLENDR